MLRIIGILPRFTDGWKEDLPDANCHQAILPQHQFLSIAKVTLHVGVARLAYLATMVARLKARATLRRCAT